MICSIKHLEVLKIIYRSSKEINKGSLLSFFKFISKLAKISKIAIIAKNANIIKSNSTVSPIQDNHFTKIKELKELEIIGWKLEFSELIPLLTQITSPEKIEKLALDITAPIPEPLKLTLLTLFREFANLRIFDINLVPSAKDTAEDVINYVGGSLLTVLEFNPSTHELRPQEPGARI